LKTSVSSLRHSAAVVRACSVVDGGTVHRNSPLGDCG